MLKIDDLARNVHRISHEIDSLKIRSMPPKLDINGSLKAIKISVDECKERTARMRAKRDWFVKACSSSFCENNDEDLKVIGVTPIEPLFYNINLDKYGTWDESYLAIKRPNDSDFIDLNAKIDKSGIGEVKTLSSDEPTLLDFKDFNYDNCSLIDCISLLQSMLNSPHANNQNKAFTEHIVDAMMQSFEEKLELKVSIPRNFMMSGNLLLRLRLKIMSAMLCVFWVLASP